MSDSYFIIAALRFFPIFSIEEHCGRYFDFDFEERGAKMILSCSAYSTLCKGFVSARSALLFNTNVGGLVWKKALFLCLMAPKEPKEASDLFAYYISSREVCLEDRIP